MINKRLTLSCIFFYLLASLSAQGALTTKTQAPGFQQIKTWLGTPLTSTQNKVVLVTFWSPANTRSLWEMQVLSRWYERYKVSAGFEIIAVAVPDFEFEKDISKTEPVINKLKLPFPVAVDPEQKLWNAYGARTIPSHFLIDTQGQIRNTFSDHPDYDAMETAIQTLLAEANPELPFIEKTKIPAHSSSTSYEFGYKDLSGFGGNEKLQGDRLLPFSYPENMAPYHFYLAGKWIPGPESLKTAPPLSSIQILFASSTAALVAGTDRRNLIPAEVRVDGRPIPKESKGRDVVIQEGKSYIFVREYRLYKLFKSKLPSAEHTLELIFEEPGIEIFRAGFE